MKKILLYIWQLPQNLVGLIIKLFLKDTSYGLCYNSKDKIMIKFTYCPTFPGGISLGDTIILGSYFNKDVYHEYGHQIQSKWLGPLYLFIIGIPSIIWAGLYGPIIKPTKNGYYKFYTEKWADKLGGVER